jgi:proton-dependent oligopeptide transporter, POT family
MNLDVPIEINFNEQIETNVNDEKVNIEDRSPNDDEWKTLEHISDHKPLASWLVVVCETCERFAFYGMTAPFQNYIQFPMTSTDRKQAGALGQGQQTATLLTTFFNFFCYLTPIVGALVADQYWGKYKTIFVACLTYLFGLLVLVLTSIPPAIQSNVALPGLIIAMFITGLATGGIKSNVSPFMAEQYTRTTPIVRGKLIA